MTAKTKLPATWLDARKVDHDLIGGAWKRLVYREGRPSETVDRAAYTLCLLEQFHRHLKQRNIFAPHSSRWRDPRAQLLSGSAWERTREAGMNALYLPTDPATLLGEYAAAVDTAYRQVAARLDGDGPAGVDEDGKLHLAALEAVPYPPSLTDLRRRVEAMMPEVDLPEMVLEVMLWVSGFTEAFVHASGNDARVADLGLSVAAVLCGHAMNVGFKPVTSPGVPALTRDRLHHVDQHYVRLETMSAANVALIEAQARVPLARTWGGGLLASVDGIRFVTPIRTIHSRPSPRFFGRRRGITWLNMLNDQAAGLAAKVVSGTPRDSLHIVDVLQSQRGGWVPDSVITDTGSYSDIVFGLLHLTGYQYRGRSWRIFPISGCGGSTPAPTTGHWIKPPAAESTSTRSPPTGKTCAGSRCRSTPAR
ncbi:Tn3 family transposase [Nocardia sp. NPDC050630]|uniref:Tn3 family transposase n=1 Tax=Nocardia sp. NPDC050630 TaxID=3364321 RepID=UPI003787DB5F